MADEKIKKDNIQPNQSHNKHICLFYNSKEDLINVLVPYFKAGLERNEFCMWITSSPIDVKEAEDALRKEIKNLDEYIKKQQIEILNYSDWYTLGGKFDPDRILEMWDKKEKWALAQGFNGVRVSGNASWVSEGDWEKLINYEKIINSIIGERNIMSICCYVPDRISWDYIFRVKLHHQSSLRSKQGLLEYF